MLAKPITRVRGYRIEGSIIQKCQVSSDSNQEDRPNRHNECAEESESIENGNGGVKHGRSFQIES